MRSLSHRKHTIQTGVDSVSVSNLAESELFPGASGIFGDPSSFVPRAAALSLLLLLLLLTPLALSLPLLFLLSLTHVFALFLVFSFFLFFVFPLPPTQRVSAAVYACLHVSVNMPLPTAVRERVIS